MTDTTNGSGARFSIPRDRPIIAHSHLRWDFVWQRPQQLLSRIAAHTPVLFVEEPMCSPDIEHPAFDLTSPLHNIFRFVPRLPARFAGAYDESLIATRELLLSVLDEQGALSGRFVAPVQWFYTPLPAPIMLGAFGEVGVVYDCMDELAQFRFAPSDLPARERLLLAEADVVFTGGRRLYESKRRHHANVHFFGCGVDAIHFGKARRDDTELPADVRDLPEPIAGYFGVIDERLDYDLLRAFAAAHPDCSVVMVGPVVKVDPLDLPRADNIHWLGQRSYEDLPAYVKSFDVCLMPFALNEATEYINPTKTLEYMAAGKPIISTAVTDVVRNFSPVVHVAYSAEEFVRLAAELMRAPDEGRIARGLEMARSSTWDSITHRMRRLIGEAVFGPIPVADAISSAKRQWSRAPLDNLGSLGATEVGELGA